jgi:hypothetical protein
VPDSQEVPAAGVWRKKIVDHRSRDHGRAGRGDCAADRIGAVQGPHRL